MELNINSETDIKGDDSMMDEILPVLKNEELMRLKNPDGFLEYIGKNTINVSEVNFIEENNSGEVDMHIVQIKSPDVDVRTDPGESGTIKSDEFGILKFQIKPHHNER